MCLQEADGNCFWLGGPCRPCHNCSAQTRHRQRANKCLRLCPTRLSSEGLRAAGGLGLLNPLCEITAFLAKQKQLNSELSAMSLFMHRRSVSDRARRRADGRVVNVGVRSPVQTPRLWAPTRPLHRVLDCERRYHCARLTALTWVAWGNTRARRPCALRAPAEP